MSSLLLLTSLLILLHLFKKYLSLGILNAPHSTVITTTVLVVYTINRSDLANSVHKFSGTLLLNLDKPNLLLIKILLVVGITTLVLITIYNTPWQKLVGFIKLLALFIICTVVIIYCKLNEVFSVGFTDLPKWFITSLTTLIYISSSYKNIRTYINRVPKY